MPAGPPSLFLPVDRALYGFRTIPTNGTLR